MLAKKQMSKKRKMVMTGFLLVIFIIIFVVVYNSFLKKPEVGIPSEDELFIFDDELELDEGGAVETETGERFNLELFEMEEFKKLKAYIDLPMEIDWDKVGNKEPFLVTEEEGGAE